jgi:hypothetical protein
VINEQFLERLAAAGLGLPQSIREAKHKELVSALRDYRRILGFDMQTKFGDPDNYTDMDDEFLTGEIARVDIFLDGLGEENAITADPIEMVEAMLKYWRMRNASLSEGSEEVSPTQRKDEEYGLRQH